MNILLWVFQILLALHTAVGGVWKFSNSEQTVGSLKLLPHGLWLAMGVFELLCSIALILPAFSKDFVNFAPVAALCIATEMLLFCGVHFYSGDRTYNHPIYWLVVAIICGLIIYGSFCKKGRLFSRPSDLLVNTLSQLFNKSFLFIMSFWNHD